VVAQEHQLALPDQVDAFARIGPVADDVAQTIGFGDALLGNVIEHRLEGLQVAVNIADDRFHVP